MSTDYFVSKSRPSFGDGSESSTPGSPAPTGSSSIRSNALSAKVTSVLSASYADLEIRDALSLLDARSIENTPETRRQLRLDVQKEVIESNGSIIREFGRVADQLKRIGNTIESLNQGCEEMRRHISASRQETRPVMEEASELMTQRNHVDTKQQLLKAFNAHFIISDDDIATLTSSAEPVDERFFTVLGRAKKIQNDCQLLLGTENERLGHEIMDQVTKNVNSAFQKLYRWIQREFKSLDLENPQIGTSIRRALRVLAERPSLFQSCLDFFSEARQSVLSDAFYAALTGTTTSGEEDKSIKPIELVAHDSLRYVGDMLAWVYSSTASEREALEALFISDGDEIAKGIRAGLENEPWNEEINGETSFNGLRALNELVDRNLSGVARVLRQRVEQVIQSYDETLMAYKIANLVKFYLAMFAKILGENSTLLELLVDLEKSAMRQFRVLLHDHISSWQGEEHRAAPDLSPPDFLQEGLKQLVDIMKTYDGSFTSADQIGADFEPILVEAFDPYMRGGESISQTLSPPARDIFTANCLLAARTALSPFAFTALRVDALHKGIEAEAKNLVGYQYSFFRQTSGLDRLIETITNNSGKDIRELPEFQPQALTEASQRFDDFLPSAMMDALENLKMLQDSKLAREVTEEAADLFCQDFEVIEDRLYIADEQNGVGDDESDEETQNRSLRAVFPRTSAQLRVLLS